MNVALSFADGQGGGDGERGAQTGAGRLPAAACDWSRQLRQGAAGGAQAHQAHLRHEGHQERACQRR